MSSNSTSIVEDIPWIFKRGQGFKVRRGLDIYLFFAYSLIVVRFFLIRYLMLHGISLH